MSRYIITSSLRTKITTPAVISSRTFTQLTHRMADKSSLDADKGSVGHEFTTDGKLGGAAQKVGGPFDKDGTVGKEFKTSGTIGGAAQNSAEGKPLFDKDGAIGRQFKEDGVVGQVGEKIGGPFKADGAIGKNFNADGAVGGTVQENLGSGKKE